jgi:glycosyltransferase involved in cell wall biosynthesis
MSTKILKEIQSMQGYWQVQQDGEDIRCSIGIMAHNEEANISRAILAILEQQAPSLRVEEVIVVASGCTDRTVPIVAEIALQEPRVHLCDQERREGKASAINLFLKLAISPVVVLIGADVIPEVSALEYLCLPWRMMSTLSEKTVRQPRRHVSSYRCCAQRSAKKTNFRSTDLEF